jgi:hypothetical protein
MTKISIDTTPLLRISEPTEQIKNNRIGAFVNRKSCDQHRATRKERIENRALLYKIAPAQLRMFDAVGAGILNWGSQ